MKKIPLNITYRPGPLPHTVWCGRCHSLVDAVNVNDHTTWHRQAEADA